MITGVEVEGSVLEAHHENQSLQRCHVSTLDYISKEELGGTVVLEPSISSVNRAKAEQCVLGVLVN